MPLSFSDHHRTKESYMKFAQPVHRVDRPSRSALGLFLITALLFPAIGIGATGHDHQATEAHSVPTWAEQLKGQTIIEDTMEGRPERTAMMERQHHRVMEQMQRDADVQRNDGFYNDVNMMHQYGAGNQDVLLMSNTGAEPVSATGGRCPKSAPVRQYDISAVNVEITLNQWLD